MKELLLVGHILIALFAVIAALVGFVTNGKLKKRADKIFTPSVVMITASGALLVVFGGSFTHACISGVVTISALYALRVLSAKHTYTIEI